MLTEPYTVWKNSRVSLVTTDLKLVRDGKINLIFWTICTGKKLATDELLYAPSASFCNSVGYITVLKTFPVELWQNWSTN